MTQELNAALESVLEKLGNDRANRAVPNMPITKEQVLTPVSLEMSEFVNNDGVKTEYPLFKTKEGFDLAASQICRRGNGLNLTSTTFGDMIREFAERIDGTYSVKVEDVKKLESNFGPGKTTYLKFYNQN